MCAHGLGGAFGFVGGTVIMDRHIPARARQVQRDGASQPLGGAGDKNGFRRHHFKDQ